jgi:hypothetical protein
MAPPPTQQSLPRAGYILMHRALATITIACLLAGAVISCKTHYPTQTKQCDTCSDTTHHPCDTCNLNQDSLSHAFAWTEYSIPGETNLTGVWVFGVNDIVIVGNSLWHYDGASFTVIHGKDFTHGVTLDGALSGFSVFAFSKKDYWLVHVSETLHTTDGLNFDNYRFGAVNACWGGATNDMFFVGNGGKIHHYDGTTFTEMASGTTKDLKSVWGTGHNDVWACGTNTSTGTTILLHYDGTSWSEDPISVLKGGNATGGFQGVWAVDSSGHKFVTTGGGWLLRKTDDGSWRSDSGLIPNYLGGKSFIGIAPRGNSPSDLMAYGPWGS